MGKKEDTKESFNMVEGGSIRSYYIGRGKGWCRLDRNQSESGTGL